MRLLPEFLGYWPGCRQAKLGLAHELNMLAKREVKRVLSSVAIRERGINKGDPSSGAGLRFSFKQGQELCITVQSWAGVLMSCPCLCSSFACKVVLSSQKLCGHGFLAGMFPL